MWVESHSTGLCVIDLLHLAYVLKVQSCWSMQENVLPFYRLNNIPWMYIPHFAYPFINWYRHLGCFHVWAIVNNAAFEHKNLFKSPLSIVMGISPKVVLLYHVVIPFWIFWAITKHTAFHSSCTIKTPSNIAQGSNFSTSPSLYITILFCFVFSSSHLNGSEMAWRFLIPKSYPSFL